MLCDTGCFSISNLIFWVVFIFGFPHYIIYQVALIKNGNGELSGSFFKLLAYIGFADLARSLILMYFELLFGGYFAWWFEFAAPVFSRAVSLSSWMCAGVQTAGCLLLTLNRFTAIVLPLSHKRLWNGHKPQLACAAVWLVCTAYYLPLLIYGEMVYTYNGNDSTGSQQFIHENIFATYYLIEAALLVLIAVCIVCLYVVMAVSHLRSRRNEEAQKKRKGKKAGRNSIVELKLAVGSFAICAGWVVWACIEGLTLITSQTAEHLHSATWASSLQLVCCVVKPFVVVACSAKMRRCCDELIGWGREDTVPSAADSDNDKVIELAVRAADTAVATGRQAVATRF